MPYETVWTGPCEIDVQNGFYRFLGRKWPTCPAFRRHLNYQIVRVPLPMNLFSPMRFLVPDPLPPSLPPAAGRARPCKIFHAVPRRLGELAHRVSILP